MFSISRLAKPQARRVLHTARRTFARSHVRQSEPQVTVNSLDNYTEEEVMLRDTGASSDIGTDSPKSVVTTPRSAAFRRGRRRAQSP